MRTVTIEEFGKKLEQRRDALSRLQPVTVTPNSGKARQQGKRLLLETLEKEARSKSREPLFKANY